MPYLEYILLALIGTTSAASAGTIGPELRTLSADAIVQPVAAWGLAMRLLALPTEM
jgi:hypothetical protein